MEVDDGMLKDACDQVINDKDLQPKINSKGQITVTHCNEGAHIVAQAMGCHELGGLMADDQHALMIANVSGCWKKVTGQEATIHALSDRLAFAAMSSIQLGETHGHIAAIYPVGMQWSGSLKKDVPMVANIGKENKEEKVSQAFPVSKGEPDYFTWTPKI